MNEQIINAYDLQKSIDAELEKGRYDKVFILTDTTTNRLCLPLLKISNARVITIGSTDSNKNLESLTAVLTELIDDGASRRSLLINLGGGMVCDLGGFAAAIFKRGIACMNIPTTLLAMVDASIGGKTGINFRRLKNEIGTFTSPVSVLIHPEFLKTLSSQDILSGYAEIIKHALIYDESHWAKVLSTEILPTKHFLEHFDMQQLVFDNVQIKVHYVDADPYEQDIRKALNFGHTFGHAFETFNNGEMLHGYAVAYGMICELYLSSVKSGFPTDKMRQTVTYIRENYGSINLECKDYDTLIQLMQHDKKNSCSQICPVLLKDIGIPIVNQPVTESEIKEAFDFLREGF